MENNKLIIGVRFSLSDSENSIFTFSVLRDITLRQLLDGLKYGLQKKITAAEEKKQKEETKLLRKNLALLNLPPNKDGQYLHIKLFRYQEHLVKEYYTTVDGEKRVVFSKTALDEKLYNLGFITSTELVFVDPQYSDVERNLPTGKEAGYDTSHVIAAFNPKNSIEYRFPEYNISTRERYKFDQEAVRIIPPSDPPAKPKGNVITGMLPGIVTMAVMMLARTSMSGFNMGTVLMTGLMAAASAISGVIMNKQQKKEYSASLKKWKRDYQAYINRIWAEIVERQYNDADQLDKLYPDADLLAEDSRRGIWSYNEHIFSRARNDEDFLTFRLGLSEKVESLFKIEGESRDVVFSNANYSFDTNRKQGPIQLHLNDEHAKGEVNNLCKLPGDIRERCRYMEDAPLLYSLKNSGALGIVDSQVHYVTGDKVKCYNEDSGTHYLIKRMIFDLCFNHSPEDLQFVIFFQNGTPDKNSPPSTKDMMDIIFDYRYLPHFHGLFNDMSQFVFDSASASAVLSQIMNMLNLRTQKSGSRDTTTENSASKYPHIVFIVFEEYNMKEHAFAQYLPKVPEAGKAFENELGISFVFAVQHKEYLPPYCTDVIRIGKKEMTLTPRDDMEDAKPFRCPEFNDGKMSPENLSAFWDRYKNAFEFFSAIYFTKIAQNGKVPSNVNMFDLMKVNNSNLEQYIVQKWGLKIAEEDREVDVTESLKVPIGKTESGTAYLDLHEKEDGPHMLVAGTTGSGKSETIISWLLGLCMYFKPEELNLLLVDMKGGGFTKRLGNLPHVVGTVTDVDGDENGTGAEYMLRRFLDAMTAEVKRRKILLNKMHVDNVDDYIRACRNIESHIKSKKIPDKEQAEVKRIAKKEKLSHLILVVDEFTELKRFTSENSDIDFIGQITTIARVGRSLGYHICLISQNIQGAITEDISVNSKSRLCLKVATPQASKEMIGNELAAAPSMPGLGRAYLRVGTGSKFVYFQSAYSGSKILNTDDGFGGGRLDDMVFKITQVAPGGAYTAFYRSDKDNTDLNTRIKELSDDGKLNTQLEAISAAIRRISKRYSRQLSHPHQVFQEPLPTCIALGEDGKTVLVKKEDLGGK